MIKSKMINLQVLVIIVIRINLKINLKISQKIILIQIIQIFQILMQRNILKIYNYFLKQNRILTSCSFGEASRNSFLFPFILYQFDKDNIYKTGPLAEFTFNMVILSLLALFCLFNI